MILKIRINHLIGKTPLSGLADSIPARKNRYYGAVLALVLVMAVFAQPGFAAKLGIMKEKTLNAFFEDDAAEQKRRALEQRLYWGRQVASLNPSLSRFEINRIGGAVLRYSGKHGLPPGLIVAVIKVESSGRVSAVSSKGAQGLMQVMPFWKKELGIKGTLFDIDNNIRAGTHILAKYIKRYGYEEGVARYYRGSLNVDGQAYLEKIQKALQV